MPSEAPGVLWVIALGARGEEGEVPIFGDVPVEGVEGVEENREKPEAEEASFAHANFGGVVAALERAEDDDRESARVFEGVSEMLASPARRSGFGAALYSEVFD